MASALVCSTVKKSGRVRNNTGGIVVISNSSDSPLSVRSFCRSILSKGLPFEPLASRSILSGREIVRRTLW